MTAERPCRRTHTPERRLYLPVGPIRAPVAGAPYPALLKSGLDLPERCRVVDRRRHRIILAIGEVGFDRANVSPDADGQQRQAV